MPNRQARRSITSSLRTGKPLTQRFTSARISPEQALRDVGTGTALERLAEAVMLCTVMATEKAKP